MAEKKVKGRKRHIVVDILGCILSVVVHVANIHDTKAGCLPAAKAYDKYPTIEAFSGDEGYSGSFVNYVGWDFDDVLVHISKRINPGFEILPKRWIVERTLAWLGNSRRLSKDYEITIVSEEAFVMISHARILLRRLCHV
jgi:putative transposase